MTCELHTYKLSVLSDETYYLNGTLHFQSFSEHLQGDFDETFYVVNVQTHNQLQPF